MVEIAIDKLGLLQDIQTAQTQLDAGQEIPHAEAQALILDSIDKWKLPGRRSCKPQPQTSNF